MTNDPKVIKERTAQAVAHGRLAFLGDAAYRAQKARISPVPQSAPTPVSPPPQKAATPVSEPAKDVKPAPDKPRETRGFEETEKDVSEMAVSPFRTTIQPPPPPKEAYPRPHGQRNTPPLPLGVTPGEEGEGVEERKPTMVPIQPGPAPAGFVQEPGTSDNIVDAICNAAKGEDRELEKLSIKQGVSKEAIMQGTAPMGASQFTEQSMVEMKVDNLKGKLPERFVPYIEAAMEKLRSSMNGYEPLTKIMMTECRWTHQQEESLGGALSAASDELQRIFSKMYREEKIRRVKNREELKGMQDPGEVEKIFAQAILSSKHASANHETNVFDAFAKGAIFVFLSQQRSRTFMHALGHPEISKPYGKLGGVEGLGVMLGLDLPDPQTVSTMPNPLIGLAFRLYSEVHLCTLAGWLVSVSSRWPKPQTVGRFESMAKHDVDEFQRAVVDAQFSTEMFFQVLSMEDHTKLREDPGLKKLFEEAAKGKPGAPLIYGHADDIFDALEAIVGYMNMLKHDKAVRNLYLDSYLSNYPIGRSGGSFYKMFGMSLFNERDDIEKHPEIVEAFKSDPDPRVQFHIRQKLEQLEVRQTLIGVMAQHAAAEGKKPEGDESDFADLNGD